MIIQRYCGEKKKGEKMEGMTDEQFIEYKETLLKLVLEKIKNSKTLEEAKEKIEALIENQNLYKTKGNLEKY